jgi:hypothetical protein
MGSSSSPEESESPSRTWRASQHPEKSRESAAASDLSVSARSRSVSRSGHRPRWIHRQQPRNDHDDQREREQTDHDESTLEPKALHEEAQQQQPQPEEQQLERQQHHSIFKLIRQGPSKVLHKTSHAATHFFTLIENYMFPPIHGQDLGHHHHYTTPTKVRGGVMLQGCESAAEHYARTKEIMLKVQGLHEEEGLEAAGFEYRFVHCDEHMPVDPSLLADDESDSSDDDDVTGLILEELGTGGTVSPVSSTSTSQPGMVGTTATSNSIRSTDSLYEASIHTPPPTMSPGSSSFCHLCMRRLFHTTSNTMINEHNRKQFIADGEMYEEMARLCQEYAHKLMCEQGNLEWVTVSEDETGQGKEPIRALVNCNHPLIRNGNSDSDVDSRKGSSDDGDGEASRGPPLIGRPTLLIATGKGKVRAGIFSRQHLMCSSVESATALPIVREAVMRKLNVVIVDPNVHGDRLGMVTFEKTMAGLFGRWESNDDTSEQADDDENDENAVSEECAQVKPLQSRDLYILSHSASGSQLARYLLDKSPYYLPHIRAIAFTDSTHNVQWCKTAVNQDLWNKLQSPECVYFRCASVPRDGNQWYLHSAGEPIQTDSFWQHRFGKIKTYWAGTNEHSLTNWYAHGKIWEHFDRFLGRIDEVSEALEKEDQEPKASLHQKLLPVD